jgi:3-hydroxybutyryl-CoA dehydratase
MRQTRVLQVGQELTGPVRGITAQRIEWYDSAMLSAATNELRQVGSNIHTDPEFAKSEGFANVNADGMIATNWCSEMLIANFGLDYIERGELRTKYIKPVNLGVQLHVKGRVLEANALPDGGTSYVLDIWCEDAAGTKLVDGGAKVTVVAG